MDGTSTTVGANSQTVTGLSASTTYDFAAYFNEGAVTIGFVQGAPGAIGSPAIAYTSQGAAIAAGMYLEGYAAFGWLSGSTPASGSGGGGGPPTCCLHGEQLIELASGESIPARDLSAERVLTGPVGNVPIRKVRKAPWMEWVRVGLSNGVSLLVAGDHRFMDPSGEQICTRDLHLHQIVDARGEYVYIASLCEVRSPGIKVSIEVAPPHTYYVQGILSHNKFQCP